MASYAVTRGCTALGHSYGNKRQPAQVVHGEGVGRVARWWCADHECQRGGCLEEAGREEFEGEEEWKVHLKWLSERYFSH